MFTLKKDCIKVIATILLLATIGLFNISNYGISYDELAPIKAPFINYDAIVQRQDYPGHIKYYGTLLNISSEITFQGTEFLRHRAFSSRIEAEKINSLDRYIYEYFSKSQFLARVKVKHILTFLLSLLAYASVAGIVGILTEPQYAWLGSITLALFPRFWGHSFFNPRNMSLAAMFTLGTFLGTYLLGYYFRAKPEKLKLGINRTTLYSLLYGIVVGLVTGARVDGSILLLFVAIAHLLTCIASKNLPREFWRFWRFYGLMFIAWAISTIIIYPLSWFNPIGWFKNAWQFFYDEDWPLTVLFKGQFVPAESPPWNYLPQWLTITIPVIWQVLFLTGLCWIVFRYNKLTDIQRAGIILVLLQIFFLPSIVIFKQATIYDGMRQFLYMLPGIAAIVATTLVWIYQKIPTKTSRLFAIALTIALISPIVWDAIALHPYEYLYFNRAFGGLAAARDRFETDYWGLSMREGMEWINNNSNSGAKVVSSEPLISSATFAASNVEVIPYEEFEPTETAKPYYYIALPRWQLQNNFPDCQVVHQVTRQDVPLAVIKKCE